MAKRLFPAVLIAASLAILGTASAQTGKGPRKVIVAMGHAAITPGEEAYMYAVPRELGYFKEEGLEVEFQPTQGSAAAVQLVATGRAHMGQGNPGVVMNAILQGAPLKLVFNIIPTYGSGLALLEQSDMRSPKDMKGKIIGVASLASGRVPEAETMIAAAGLKPDVDVKLVAVGTGAQAAAALTSGRVAGLYLWDAAYAAIEGQGVKLRIIKDVFPGAEKLLDFVQFANQETIEKDPGAIAAFGRGAAKGMLWSLHNPEGALALFYKTFPDARAKDDRQRAADQYMVRFATKQVDIKSTPLKGWGHFPDDYVAATTAFLVRNRVLKESRDPRTFYTNQFVDGYNRFDAEQIIKAARAYKG